MLNIRIDSKVPDVLGIKGYKQFEEAFRQVHAQLQEVFPDGQGTVVCNRIDVQVTRQTRWVPPDGNNPAIMVTHPTKKGTAVMFIRIFDVSATEIYEKMRAKEKAPLASMAGALEAAGLVQPPPLKEEPKPAAKKAAKKAPARRPSARSSDVPFGLDAQDNLELLVMGLVEWRNGDLHRCGSSSQTLFYQAVGEVLLTLNLADEAPTEEQVELVFNRLRGQEEVAYDDSVDVEPPLYRLSRKRVMEFWRQPESPPAPPPPPETAAPPASPPACTPPETAPPPALPPACTPPESPPREPEAPPAPPPPATGLNGAAGGVDLLLRKLQNLPTQKEQVLEEIRDIQARRLALQAQVEQVEADEAAAQRKLRELEALEADPEIARLLKKLEVVDV